MHSASKYPQAIITFFVLILNIPAAASVDLYVPSLPAMMHYFSGSPGLVQLTIPVYLLGMACSQWICGFLSDIKGRRPMFLWTATIFLLGSLVCVFSKYALLLLLGRFLQGIGSGTSAMIAPALINEAILPKRTAKISSYFGMAYAMIPIFAPLIGGLVQHYFHWQANFIVLFAIMLFAATAVLFFLPETCQTIGQKKFNLTNLIMSSYQVIYHRPYLRAVIALTALWSLIPIFSLIAPFIIQIQLKQNAAIFGVFAMLVGVGFFLGSLSNNRLLNKYASGHILNAALILMGVFCTALIILSYLHILNLSTLLIPTFLIMYGLGLCFPCVYEQAVTAHSENIGLAGALIGCCILLGAVIVTGIISSLHITSSLGLGIAFAVCTAITWSTLAYL